MRNLYHLKDDETRFWIAQGIASTKNALTLRLLFSNGVEIAEKEPKVLIMDREANFHEASMQELGTN